MTSPLSMTTGKPKRSKPKLTPLWRLKRTASGEMEFVPIHEKKVVIKAGGTITATLPSRVVMEDGVRDVSEAISSAGGSVSHLRGRLMMVEVSGDYVEAVGDVMDSFGCEWDLEKN